MFSWDLSGKTSSTSQHKINASGLTPAITLTFQDLSTRRDSWGIVTQHILAIFYCS